MDVSEFKEELSKKIIEFQQKLFGIDNLEDLKDEADSLIEELKSTVEDIEDEVDNHEEEEEDEYYNEEEENEEESDDLDSQIKGAEKNFPSSNNSLLSEQERLRKELGL